MIVVGHCQQIPEECEEDMFARNCTHVRNAAIFASEFCPDAVFCVATSPVNSLVPMVSEVKRTDPKHC